MAPDSPSGSERAAEGVAVGATLRWRCGNCGYRDDLTAFYGADAEGVRDYRCPSCGTTDNAHLRIPRIDLRDSKGALLERFYIPTPKQVMMHLCTARNLLWGGRAGTGKLIHHDTPIPTPRGWRRYGDLQVGDALFDEHGRVCRMTWRSPTHTDPDGTYRVVFDDGTSVVAGARHEWWTYTYNERRRRLANTPERAARRRARRPSRAKPHDGTNQKPWTTAVLKARNRAMSEAHEFRPVLGGIRETQAIARTLKTARGKTNHAVPLAGDWELPERDLPIDPYVLGVWLGDGTRTDGSITSADPEILAEVERAGYPCVFRPSSRYAYGTRGLATQLRTLGVLGNKHIPHEYLWASAAQRLALLQGLMDTDGSCDTRGAAEFCSTNKALAEGVLHLARSLGIKAFWREDRARVNGADCGPRYRVSWTSTVPVFRLPRKLARIPTRVRDTQRYRYIVAVERIADEAMSCIEVDSPSHLYLCTEAGIPTHNSWALRHDAYMRCLSIPGYRVLLLRRNFTELRDTHLDKAAIEVPKLTGHARNWRASEYTAIFPHPNGAPSRLRFGHCETDADVKQYLSSEFDLIIYDEGATFTEYSVRFINSRLRTAKPGVVPMVRVGSNPGAAWLYRYYIAKDITAEEDPSYRAEDYVFIPATIDDNPHVNLAEQNLRLAALPSEALRRMYAEGDWTAVEGQFFTEWRPSKDGRPWHVIQELPTVFDPMVQAHVPIDAVEWIRHVAVVDWGYDPDPGALILYALLPSGRAIAVAEWTFRRTIVPEVARKAVEFCRGRTISYRIGGHDMWMSDKQVGESMAETFARAGFSMRPADTDREQGWQRLHTMLTEVVYEGDTPYPRLQVYGPGCPNLARTIPMLQADPKRPGDILQRDDHWADTARWFAMSRPRGSRSPTQTAWDRLPKDVKAALLRQSSTSVLGSESVRRGA